MADPLQTYREMRDFARTGEPPGGTRPPGERPVFVIQRHQASTLHYDFRLEVDGVLKSWAVPKGPPERVGERRLAVPTEDHPLEYAEFAGEIPEGEYGAGEVEIWDSGTYRNLRAEKPDAEPVSMAQALEEGKVEVHLDGKRVQADFALIRTDGDEEARWLLVRMKPRHAEDDGGDE